MYVCIYEEVKYTYVNDTVTEKIIKSSDSTV
jgi:hypothetical protein